MAGALGVDPATLLLALRGGDEMDLHEDTTRLYPAY
jgi:hypothetical protein